MTNKRYVRYIYICVFIQHHRYYLYLLSKKASIISIAFLVRYFAISLKTDTSNFIFMWTFFFLSPLNLCRRCAFKSLATISSTFSENIFEQNYFGKGEFWIVVHTLVKLDLGSSMIRKPQSETMNPKIIISRFKTGPIEPCITYFPA